VDCIHFVAAVVTLAGLIPRPQMPFYDERLGSLRNRNIMEDIVLEHCHAESHPVTDPPEFGDIVICQCGRQTNHTGIIIDGLMWHVPAKGFVAGEPWEEWQPRAQALVRITATGYKKDPSKLTWQEVKGRADTPA
jgi:hypothetical protein